jgi:hypothetical protein
MVSGLYKDRNGLAVESIGEAAPVAIPSKRRRIRIVSDGGVTAEITDAGTGAPIPRVTAVTIELRAGERPVATITSDLPSVDVIAEAAGPIPDTEAVVRLLEHIGPALYRIGRYADAHYGPDVARALKDAAGTVMEQVRALAPPESEHGDG